MLASRIKSFTLPGGVLLASFIYLSLFWQYGFYEADEGIPLNGAMRILNGEIPWKDFQGYPPGRYYFYALILKFFGMDILPVRIAIAFLTAATVTMIVVLCRKIMTTPFALLAGFLFVIAPGIYYGRYMQFLTALAIFLFCRYCEGRPYSALHIGLGAGFAFWVRFDMGVIILVSSLCVIALKDLLCEKNPPKALTHAKQCIFGTVLFCIPTIFFLFYLGIFEKVYSFHKEYIFGGYQTLGLNLPQWGSVPLHEWGLFYIPIVIYATGALVLLRSFKKEVSDPFYFYKVFIFVIGVFTFHQAAGRIQPENILKTIIPVLMFFCFICSVWYARIRLRVLKIISIVGILFLPGMYTYTMIGEYGFYLGSAGLHPENYKPMKLERARVYGPKHLAGLFPELVSYVKETTRPGENIYIIPFMGLPIYFLSDRRNPSFYEWILPPEINTYPHPQQDIIEVLEDAQVDLIIYYEFALDSMEERRFKNYAPRLYRYLFDHYYLDKTVGNYWMLRRGESNIVAFQSTQNGSTGEVKGDISVGQTFMARKNNLNEIKVRLVNYWNLDSGELILHMREFSKPGEELVRVKSPITDPIINEWLSFSFPPIEDSKGKTYYFHIEAPQPAEEKSFGVWRSTDDRYEGGASYRNDREEEGDLAFIALAKRGG